MHSGDIVASVIPFPGQQSTGVGRSDVIVDDVRDDISMVIPIRTCLDCRWVMLGTLGEFCGIYKEDIVEIDWAMDCEEFEA